MKSNIGRLPAQCSSTVKNLCLSGVLGLSSHVAFADYVFLAGQLNDAHSNAELTDDIPGYTGSGFVYMGSGKGSARWTDRDVVPGKYRITIYYQGTDNNAGAKGRMRLRVNGDTVKEFKHVPLVKGQELRVMQSDVTISELGTEIALIRKNGAFLVDRFVLAPEDGTPPGGGGTPPGGGGTPPGGGEIAKQCAMQSATCGVILDKLGRSIDCGEPLEGEWCVDNQSEQMCTADQLDDGKLDDLFAYIPIQFTDEDISYSGIPVKTTMFPVEIPEPFPFISRTNLGGKKLELDLEGRTLSSSMTVSFKFIPDEKSQSQVIFSSDTFQIEQKNSGLKTAFDQAGRSVAIENETNLKVHSCNHYAVTVDSNSVNAWLNGKANAVPTNTSDIAGLADSLAIGPYPGRVWDVRIFDKALSREEVSELGEDCTDEPVMASPHLNTPNYLCGVYSCIWWRDGVTDTTQENFEYQVESHNMTYEHNILASLIYKKGDFCEGRRATNHMNIKLSDEYRKRWVNNKNFDRPVGNFWLHENFHAYQRNVRRGIGKWFAESSANWAAYSMKPGTDSNHLLGMYTLQPHQPLWARERKPAEWTAFSEYSGGHMYGSGLFTYYLTENYVGKGFVGNAIRYPRNEVSGLPEAMYKLVGEAGFDMRDIFGEFAAKTITWDYPHGEGFKQAEDSSRRRMAGKRNSASDPWPEEDIDNKITAVYEGEGTGGSFVDVPDRYLPGSWAYNAYQVNVDADQTYRVALRTSTENVDFAEFRTTVVVHNEASGERKYFPIQTDSPGQMASVNVPAEAGNKLYLVVATTPSKDFSSYTMYRYEYSIEPQ